MFLLKSFILFLPWPLKRKLLCYFFGYKLDPSAKIGFSWIYPKMLIMDQDSKISHLSVAINLDKVILHKNASIGRFNWITGFPLGTQSQHFQHQSDRSPILILKESSAITKNHHIDCTNRVEIGKFSIIAGYNTQILTHSIDVKECRQDSNPVKIGEYCFIGTNCIILGGSTLPNRSILGAKSLLNKCHDKELSLYAGVPASRVKSLSDSYKFFSRTTGFVY